METTRVSLSRPVRAKPAMARPEQRARIFVFGNAERTLGGRRYRPLQKPGYIHAGQGCRKESEVGQDGITPTYLRGIEVDFPEFFPEGQGFQGSSGVGYRHEISTCLPVAQQLLDQISEVAIERQGFHRASGLGGHQEQGFGRVYFTGNG